MAEFQIVDGVLKKYNGSEATVVIPDTVSVIGESAFEGCPFTSLVIPAAVKKYPAPPSAIARCSQR